MLILITEDIADIRDLMTMLLKSCGHQVTAACNGVEAIAAAAAEHPDLILMDLQMPVMDGFEAMRHLRTDPRTSNIPILAVSAYVGDKTWCAKAMAAGARKCISKPVDYAALESTLHEYCGT